MTEHDDQADKSERPEQAAALNQEPTEEQGEEQDTPQDETDSTMFDTEQHSDAPGPFGTS